MEVRDFLFGDDGDLAIVHGDLAYGESTLQHQRDLLVANKGSFRQDPLIGVGINEMLLDNTTADELRTVIQRELERDGMVLSRLRVTLEDVYIEAEYA